MIQTEAARNNGNTIQMDIELLVDTSSLDLLNDTLDVPLHFLQQSVKQQITLFVRLLSYDGK